MEASRTLLYRIINILEGSNNSVAYALDILVEDVLSYDICKIEKQLQLLGYYRCKQCQSLLQVSSLKLSGGEDLCKECY